MSATTRLATGLCAVLLWGCGSRPDTNASRVTSLSPERAYWEEIAPTCAGHPSKADCVDGDMALFGGLLCASGEARGCDLVRASQDADGRWWRSPRRTPGNAGEPFSFSRDMALGAFLYLVTTKDRDAATRWLDWIEGHRACVTRNPFGGCAVWGPFRYCTDDADQRCALTPASWGLMGRVFEALGLPKNREMRLYDGADGDALWMTAQSAPIGFELHLNAVEVLLKLRLDQARSARERAAGILADRQPGNPFFAYLKDPSDTSLPGRLLEVCPRPGDPTGRRQWAWERDTESRAWLDSMGWDCLFLANLLSLE